MEVRFYASPDGGWAEPVQAAPTNVIPLAPRRSIPAYVDLRAAAGHATSPRLDPEAQAVWLPIEADRPDLFAVRVCGHSMDGGRALLRDGDWAVLRLARGAPASTAALTSDNPSGPNFDAGPDTVVIAKLERAISPESLAPPTGTVIADDDLATRFDLHELHPKTGRHAGRLFLFIDTKGVLESPARLRLTGLPTPWPGETGFALARESDTTWRYLGVARTTESANVWSIPEVDSRTWRRWGTGRAVSRALPEGALARAQEVVDHLLALPESERPLTTRDEKTARILGPAEKGGLRIDGGEGGFSARTISLTASARFIASPLGTGLRWGGATPGGSGPAR